MSKYRIRKFNPHLKISQNRPKKKQPLKKPQQK